MEKKLNWVTGLKGIGACAVAFFWHWPIKENQPFYHIFPTLFQYGFLAVEMFYALSGFGVVLGYEKKFMKSELSLGRFMKSRVKKIYPLFIFTLLFTICVNILLYIYRGGAGLFPYFDAYRFVLNILLLHAGVFETNLSFNGPSWFISVLMFLYVSFFFVVDKYIEKKRHFEIEFAYLVMFIIGGVLYMSGWQYPLFNQTIGRGLISFYGGVLTAKICEKKFSKNFQYIIGGLCLSFIVFCYIFSRLFGFEKVLGNISMIAPVSIMPCIILGCYYLPFLGKIIGNRVFVFLGSISMYIYLIHHPVYYLLMCLNEELKWGGSYNSRLVFSFFFLFVIGISCILKLIFDRISIWRGKYEKN